MFLITVRATDRTSGDGNSKGISQQNSIGKFQNLWNSVILFYGVRQSFLPLGVINARYFHRAARFVTFCMHGSVTQAVVSELSRSF